MSSTIDWSKAPEGATHCSAQCMEFYRPAKNAKGGEFYSADRGAWIMLCDDFDYLVSRPHVVPKPIWTGQGLPPVGTVCEWRDDDFGDWRKVEVKYMSKHTALLAFDVADDCEGAFSPASRQFRPIRTPEQIAAEAREKAIGEMVRRIAEGTTIVGMSDATSCAMALYDAGYRKVEQP